MVSKSIKVCMRQAPAACDSGGDTAYRSASAGMTAAVVCKLLHCQVVSQSCASTLETCRDLQYLAVHQCHVSCMLHCKLSSDQGICLASNFDHLVSMP